MNIWAWIYVTIVVAASLVNVSTHLYNRKLGEFWTHIVLAIITGSLFYFGFIHHG